VARDIFENYHGVNFWGDKIIAETRDRENIIKYFQEKNSDDTFHILASVRVLDESVDIPRCDTVFITCIGEKSSDIRMTQRGMRASRIDPKNPSKHNTIALWASGWESCIHSLDNLRCSDPEFHKKINVATCDYNKQIELNEIIDRESENIIAEVKEYFEMRSVGVWEQKLQKWIEIYNKLGRAPSQSSKDIDERNAAIWQNNQRQAYKNKYKHMTSERIKILEKTTGWKWEEADAWLIQYENYVEIYNKLGRQPSLGSKDIDEKSAAQWQQEQRQAYKNKYKRMTSERIKILEETTGWKWGADAWLIQYENYVEIYNKLGRQPSHSSKNADEKNAAKWRGHQRKDYKNKEKRMTSERIKILEEIPGWKWEEIDTWSLQLEHWKQQYKKLGKRPSLGSKDIDEKSAAQWQQDQRQNYKNKKKCMTSERIKILEETTGWKWGADEWLIQYENYVEIYNKLGRQPSTISQNLDEKKAGQWQSTERKHYKKGEMSPERIKILEETPGWTWSSR
jgi:hypothetical protein